jgi:hypothetical protein
MWPGIAWRGLPPVGVLSNPIRKEKSNGTTNRKEVIGG